MIAQSLCDLASNVAHRREESSRAARICDGLGARRVAGALAPWFARDGMPITLRPVGMADAELMHRWQQIPAVRRHTQTRHRPLGRRISAGSKAGSRILQPARSRSSSRTARTSGFFASTVSHAVRTATTSRPTPSRSASTRTREPWARYRLSGAGRGKVSRHPGPLLRRGPARQCRLAPPLQARRLSRDRAWPLSPGIAGAGVAPPMRRAPVAQSARTMKPGGSTSMQANILG